MNVDEIIDEDFAKHPDDKICITYVSMIFKAFQKTSRKDHSKRSIEKCVENASQSVNMINQLQKLISEFEVLVNEIKKYQENYFKTTK